MKDFQPHLLLYFVMLEYELLHEQQSLNFTIKSLKLCNGNSHTNERAIPIKKIRTVPNILIIKNAATRRSTSIIIGRSCKTVVTAVFSRVE
jgi:hypothetical protein